MCCYHCSAAAFVFLVINCENQSFVFCFFVFFCLITLFLTFPTHHCLLPCCAELTRQLAMSLCRQAINPLTEARITSVFIRIHNAVTHRDGVLCCTGEAAEHYPSLLWGPYTWNGYAPQAQSINTSSADP